MSWYLDLFDNIFGLQNAEKSLNSLKVRAGAQALAWDYAGGNVQLRPGEASPLPVSHEASEAFMRIQRSIVTRGPQIFRARVGGTVGSVTWGDVIEAGKRRKTKRMNNALDDLDLERLAKRGAEAAFVCGITAYLAALDDRGRPRLTRLGGYLEPLSDPSDVDTVTALLQGWEATNGSWTVRIYDLEEMVWREWVGVDSIEKTFGRAPDREEAMLAPPRIVMAYSDDAGLPVGEMIQGVHMLRAEMAAQFRVLRNAELYGFPVPFFAGAIEKGQQWGPGIPVISQDPTAKFSYVFPEGIDELVKLHRESLEALREFFSMPGGLLGNDTPSGEAIREANVKFNQASNHYARLLSKALSDAVADFALLLELPAPPQIEVIPATLDISAVQTNVDAIIALWEAGLLPLDAAIRAIQPLIPGWSDEEVEAFLASKLADQAEEDLEEETLEPVAPDGVPA